MDHVQNNPPSLVLDPDSPKPVLHQIVDGIRQLLVHGGLRPGDRLPSSRTLARDLGVHFNTVAQAYRELEAEGWLELRRRQGTVVMERAAPRLSASKRRRLAHQFADAFDALASRFLARGLDSEMIRTAVQDALENSGDQTS